MKNCIIVHGGPLTEIPEKFPRLHELYWQPWVKNELVTRGIPCETPAMPDPWLPRYEHWKEELGKYSINEETVLVGHSRGVAFLIRWLGDTKHKIHKLIMVAPNLSTESINLSLQDFYFFDIDSTIQTQASERIIFTSENDDLENIESAQLLARKLNCKVVNLKNHGHYITEEMGGDEFPELLQEILK